MNRELIEMFKNREVKAKDIFVVEQINVKVARNLITNYHYLGTKKFMITYAYGIRLADDTEYLGAAVFGQVGGGVALKGWFGLSNGSHIVYDNRFNKYYTCPKCTGKLEEV